MTNVTADPRLVELDKTISFNDLTAIQTKEGRQCLLVICKPGLKEPAEISVQGQNMTAGEVYEKLRTATEKYNVGHALTTRQLDFDFDITDANTMRAFKYFMPATPYKLGRKSKPDSHWIYNLDRDYYEVYDHYRHVTTWLQNNFRTLDQGEGSNKLQIEVWHRTHKDNDFASYRPAQHKYVFAPGSFHDSGEMIVWQKDFKSDVSPVTYDPRVLIKRACLSIIASFIVPFWTEGSRQFMSMALAGSLYKYANIKEAADPRGQKKLKPKPEADVTLDDDVLLFNIDDFKYLIQGICELAGDKEVDDRVNCFVQTWRKSEFEDRKVSGMPTLKKFIGVDGNYLEDALFTIISGVSSEVNINELCDRFFILTGPGKIIDLDRMPYSGHFIMSRREFSDSFASRSVIWRGKRMPLSNFVYQSGVINSVDGLDFKPPERITLKHFQGDERPDKFFEQEGGVYANSYVIPKTPPHTEPVTDDEVKPLLDYIKDVFGEEEQNRLYILAFIANLIQQPAVRARTYPIIISPEHGVGKSLLFEECIVPILGRHLGMFSSDVEQVFSRFNSDVQGKLLVVLEEAAVKPSKGLSAKIRHFVTGSTVRVEYKGINPREVANYARPVFISNSLDSPVAMDWTSTERRAVVIRASNKWLANDKYFEDLVKFFRANLGKIHRWLLDYQYDEKSLNYAHQTKAKQVIQERVASIDIPEVSWALDKLEDGFPISPLVHQHWWQGFHSDNEEKLQDGSEIDQGQWPDVVSVLALAEDFRQWARQHGVPSYKLQNCAARVQQVLTSNKTGMMTKIKRKRVHYNTGPGKTMTAMPLLYKLDTVEEICATLENRYGNIAKDRIEAIMEARKTPEELGIELEHAI